MTTQQFLIEGWHWDPFALAVCGGVLAGCWWMGMRTPGRASKPGTGSPLRTRWLWLGLAALVVALMSPVATLASRYLFSAHMLQHMLLLLVAPPLLLLSLAALNNQEPIPIESGHRTAASARQPYRDRYQAGTRWRPRGKWGRILTTAPATWMAGVGAMWLWHVPLLCNAATSSLWVYRFQVVSLLLLGALFWWPVFGPSAPHRLSPLAGVVYLVSACFGCTLLGIYVTFTPVSVCSVYTHPADPLGLLPLIRGSWGITPELDQHLGGLLMWVPACFIYLSAVVGLLARWYSWEETTGGTVASVPH